MNLKNKNLALFLTDGMSLHKWHEIGMLEREIAPYNYLADFFDHIYIFSYGGSEDLQYNNQLKNNVSVVIKKSTVSNSLYQLTLPFLYRKLLSKCQFYKTNQIYGSIPAIISKILFRKNILVIRSGYIATLNAKLYKKTFYKRAMINMIEWLAYNLCNISFIPTKENADYLINRYGFLKKKLFTLNNSINIEIFKPINCEKKYDIGYVGRLNADKNLLNLLEAIKDSGYKVCFIGRGEEKDSLEKYAQENSIDLEFIDKVNNYDLPKYYSAFKIYAFPSLHEGNPKTLLEAMACGLPIVGCDVIGVNNIIKDGKNGLLSRPDASNLKEKIVHLMSNQSLMNDLGQQARQFIKQNYDFSIIINKELDIYNKALTR
ncbi:glycosyltransferase [Patescibacteria group bacterium]|nr:glycosyltransferase [Patescibacteria group bacterium]MBU1889968.1 glycosyltransferase [Patescibacteria group bacterium]